MSFFDLFKKPVRVECDSLEEIMNVIAWLQAGNDYLSNLSRTEYEIGVRTTGILSPTLQLKGFYIDIPYDIAKRALRESTMEQSFDPIRVGRNYILTYTSNEEGSSHEST